MTHGKFYTVKAICLLLILTILVSGCGNGTPTEKPETPTWLGVICPETDPLPPNDPNFTPVFGDITQEGVFFIRTGLYTNTLKQTFDITVKGTDENVVREYTDNLRVCMELLSFKEPTFQTDVTDEAAGDDLSEDEILLENTENLLFVANPSDANKDTFSEGYIWVYVIDPSIAKDAKHDYRKYCRDSAKTTVTVGASGSVKATHSRMPPGGSNSSSSRNVLANSSTSWTYSTKATYDLLVVGTSTGTTKYSVSGTIWNFGFTSGAPGGGGSNCPNP